MSSFLPTLQDTPNWKGFVKTKRGWKKFLNHKHGFHKVTCYSLSRGRNQQRQTTSSHMLASICRPCCGYGRMEKVNQLITKLMTRDLTTLRFCGMTQLLFLPNQSKATTIADNSKERKRDEWRHSSWIEGWLAKGQQSDCYYRLVDTLLQKITCSLSL